MSSGASKEMKGAFIVVPSSSKAFVNSGLSVGISTKWTAFGPPSAPFPEVALPGNRAAQLAALAIAAAPDDDDRDDGERERAVEAAQGRLHRILGAEALVEVIGDEMHHDFGVGVAFETVALTGQFALQFGEVLDDAVVDQSDLAAGMGVGIAFTRCAMCGPAGVAYADIAAQRLI